MEAEIIQDTKNPFLSRQELLMEFKHDVAPSIDEIKSHLKKDPEVVVVRRVHSNFGKRRFLAEIMVYDSVEMRDKVETVPKKIRIKLEEERKDREAEEKKKAEEEAKAAAEASIADVETAEEAAEKTSDGSSAEEPKAEIAPTVEEVTPKESKVEAGE